VEPGDRILGIGDTDVADAAALRDLLVGFDPEVTVTVRILRADRPLTIQTKLGRQETTIPDQLPSPFLAVPETTEDRPPVGVVEVKIPEFANKCVAYVPEDYNPLVPCGLIVWLHAPGDFNQDQLISRWKPLCDENRVILLAPQSADVRRWTSLETEFVRKTIDDILTDYSIDSTRVVLHGHQSGGVMAYLVAFLNRDVVRGVAAVAAPPPIRMQDPETDPELPLSILSACSESSPAAARMTSGEERLKELAFPVISRRMPGSERYLNQQELAELIRWMDTLDRI
jgi:poly(3-hydroxybutyrate) depolymerase